MVILTNLSVEDPEDESPLLPEAAESTTSTPVFYRQQVIPCREKFLTRKYNLIFSLILLIGCYVAILIPAYFPLNEGKSLSDDYQYSSDQAMLNRSAPLLSSPCQPHWCLDHLKTLSCSAGLLDLPVFVQQDQAVQWNLSPPLGLQGSEEHLALALASLPQPGLPPSLRRDGSCRRCVVVGSGGVLHGSHLGSHIDQYDVIIRMNNAPVCGFERDAGSRTTIRLIYPEGAPRSENEYKNTNMVALVVFKSLDLDWLTSVITKQPLSFWSKLWFWRDVVDDIPMKPENLKILHPEIMHNTEEVLKRYALNHETSVPTLGASAVVMAMQLCDQVSLAGFGYDMQHPEARLHYYEAIRMDFMKAQVVHDISAEKLFLRDLVSAGAVTDLTGAL
ncbi:ST3 beta-galactoside alpha-2,3-sialyltransferase 7 [Gouania willdenowi]|uniref:Lactosylceramide alpha-2,3-sialyltransferase n=1 Tax=Gouania willdenowi TaxID=441366 RepID=A0A8C5G6D4_GOUWI|nr:lactosylceramide alpha-2,3-sialyltransferase-like [Gouania willdenowi]XP_028324525.1 lactosylceramide alpha-2,3-sialyltransferase-like [Gouania willdenowi]XP_028324527.1 lactosylceramide alpha-2,3-sialyltransferase-like [Gouania willdenowi]XP_028324528.1 lactosylceramide alpha-2,3-sialyltransferase-like [Gouania willdenowi]